MVAGKNTNFPSPMWELEISVSASSFPKVLYLASVVYMHVLQSLFSQNLTEKPSADFQRVNQSSSFSLLCKAALQNSVLQMYLFICLGIPEIQRVCLQLKKPIRLSLPGVTTPCRQRAGDIHWTLLTYCLSLKEHWTTYSPMLDTFVSFFFLIF